MNVDLINLWIKQRLIKNRSEFACLKPSRKLKCEEFAGNLDATKAILDSHMSSAGVVQ